MVDSEQPQVIQFVTFDALTGEMSVTPEAMGFLAQLPSGLKIAPVCVVGPISTGKSFLCNILLQNLEAFSVAKSTQTSTHSNGIQMWSQLIQVKRDLSILLMDTQGLQIPATSVSLGALRSPRGTSSTTSHTTSSLRSPPRSQGGSNVTQKNSQLSTDKLLQLALLLSSNTIFNMQGAISDRLLDYLEPIARLSDQLHKELKQDQDSSAINDLLAPHFTCLVRDYIQIDLKTISSYTPTSQGQLLEQTFKQASSVAVKKQKLQETLRSVFKQRDCYTLPKPAKLQTEESFEQQASSLDFQTEGLKMLQEIKSKVQPKVVSGKAINGNMLLGLAIEYTQILQGTPKPDLSLLATSIDKVASSETERQQELAFSNFEEYLSTHKVQMPQKDLTLQYQKQLLQYKAALRMSLSEFLPFSEVIAEADQFEDRATHLMQSYLDENYSVGYQLSVDVLNKLCGVAGQQSSAVGGLKERWNQIYADFAVCDTENMYQVFAESLGSHPSNCFVDFGRVTPREIAQSMADTEEDSIAQQDGKDLLKAELPQILDLLTSEVDRAQSQMQAQLSELQYQTQLSYSENEQNESKKTECQSEMDICNQKMQKINLEKNDFTLELESIARQIQEERQNVQDETDLQQMQGRRQESQQSEQLKEYDTLISKQQDRVESLSQQSLSLEDEISKESSQLNIEVKKYEGEIQALKDDIEAIEQRLQRSEKSVMFKTTLEFLQNEMPNKYISKIKEFFEEQQTSKDLKLKLFQKQRDLNQMRNHVTEQESEARKSKDKQFNDLKSKLQQQLSGLQKQHQDKVKQGQTSLGGKMEMEQRLTDSMMEFVTQKETNFGLVESLENADMACEKSLAMIVNNRSNLVQRNEQMMQLEEDSYELTITNQAKVSVREKLIELLPEMVNIVQKPVTKSSGLNFYGGSTPTASSSGTDNLQKALRMIDDDMCRSKVAQILKKYKLTS